MKPQKSEKEEGKEITVYKPGLMQYLYQQIHN